MLDKQDWTTYSTVPLLESYADMHLLRWAHETGHWSGLGAHWKSGFMPEGELVMLEGAKAASMVIKVLKGCVVSWPLDHVSPDKVKLRELPSHLDVQIVLSLDKMYVQPTKLHSPLHRHLANEKDRLGGFVFTFHEDRQPLLEWHADRGFAGVPELSLQKMLHEFEVGQDELAAHVDGASTAEEKMALLLMMRVKPHLELEKAAKGLLSKQLADDHERCGYVDDIDEEAIADCVLLGDRKDTAELLRDHSAAKEKRQRNIATTKAMVDNFFPAAQEIVKRARKTAKAKRQAADALDERRRHFVAELSEDASRVLLAELPPSVKVYTDLKYGRWTFSHPSFKPRSISWTRRGEALAAIMVVTQAWGWHTAETGEPMPDHLQGHRLA